MHPCWCSKVLILTPNGVNHLCKREDKRAINQPCSVEAKLAYTRDERLSQYQVPINEVTSEVRISTRLSLRATKPHLLLVFWNERENAACVYSSAQKKYRGQCDFTNPGIVTSRDSSKKYPGTESGNQGTVEKHRRMSKVLVNGLAGHDSDKRTNRELRAPDSFSLYAVAPDVLFIAGIGFSSKSRATRAESR